MTDDLWVLTRTDWIVITLYLVAMLGLGVVLSRRQKSGTSFLVGDRRHGAVPVAISVLATQCSTNSILGAPAFIAFSVGGGLVWLQYELALPFAMIVVLLLLYPVFRRQQLTSIYSYLENRFDRSVRLALSGVFQLIRCLATAVTLYGVALLTGQITGLSFFWSVMLLGVFTLIYDYLGGIQGVIYSDVIQMFILVTTLAGIAVLMIHEADGILPLFEALSEERRQVLDFRHHGLGDGVDFAFWPMLVGGMLLYVSYYGCDQSQMQRLLATKSVQSGQRALLINGLFRFPLVALYCFLGVGLAYHSIQEPGFLGSLIASDGTLNLNLAVPAYMSVTLPSGVLGLGLVALFAAAMSSIDSVLNSLSAASLEDFVKPRVKRPLSDAQTLIVARVLTALWGILTLGFTFLVGDIADTVIVAINKIGSLINGPILGVFLLGLLTRFVSGKGALFGLGLGLLMNVGFWLWVPSVSWLWWNLIGLVTTLAAGCLGSLPEIRWVGRDRVRRRWGRRKGYLDRQSQILLGYGMLLIAALVMLNHVLLQPAL